MKKREFQRKAALELYKRFAEICVELEKVPSITVCTKRYSHCLELRSSYNKIQITIKQTGEINYQLTDVIGSTGGKQIYYLYGAEDSHGEIIAKFVNDFGRLYKDFLLAGALHDFDDIKLSYDTDAEKALMRYESEIERDNL